MDSHRSSFTSLLARVPEGGEGALFPAAKRLESPHMGQAGGTTVLTSFCGFIGVLFATIRSLP